jgi:RNA ligase (TIGR02306 family)
MTRKLVTVRQVSAVNPIEGADSIERITIEGWNVVSQKGNYQQGDFAVYFEIDSFLPDGDERWQDLVDKAGREYEGKRGHRLRTIKLRGQVSQGFSIPLRKFPEIARHIISTIPDFGTCADLNDVVAKAGEHLTAIREQDFAELLGVVKWEPPIPPQLVGQVKGMFPSFIRKTDQERVQNMPNVVNDNEAEYEVTMKLDGSSLTIYHFNGEVGVCSRNLELKVNEDNKDNTLIKTATTTGVLNMLQNLGRNIAIQGELMGPGIQGNRENLKDFEFHVFDIFDIDRQEYMAPEARWQLFEIITHNFQMGKNFKHVPILEQEFKIPAGTTIEDLLAKAEGPSITHPIREGLVYKRMDGLFSFKTISNKFLLKEKD